MIKGHGGNIYELSRDLDCLPGDIIDMSSNTNPLGPPPELFNHLKKTLTAIDALPEVDSKGLLDAFSKHNQMDQTRVLAGNGTTQFIFLSPRVLQTQKALILGPTYGDYGDACRIHGVDCRYVMADESALFLPDLGRVEECLLDADTLFICNPNNPTGCSIKRKDLLTLCERHPDVRFVIDESYLPFTDRPDDVSMIHNPLDNVIVLHSYSKMYCIPGLRLGFLTASPEYVEAFRYRDQPWSVNRLAQIAGCFLLEHPSAVEAFQGKTLRVIKREQERLINRVREQPAVKIFPSITSYALIKLLNRLDAERVCSAMARQRILLRNCSNFKGLSDRFVRISLKDPEINARVTDKFLELFD